MNLEALKDQTRADEENQKLEASIHRRAGGTEGRACDRSWDCQEGGEATDGKQPLPEMLFEVPGVGEKHLDFSLLPTSHQCSHWPNLTGSLLAKEPGECSFPESGPRKQSKERRGTDGSTVFGFLVPHSQLVIRWGTYPAPTSHVMEPWTRKP